MNRKSDNNLTTSQSTSSSIMRFLRSSINRIPVAYLLLFVSLCCATPFFFAFIYYGYLQIFEHIVPGVHVGEVDLSWQRIAEAADELNTQWNLARKITVTDEMQTWQLYPAELGLSINAYKTAEQAYEVGRFQPVLDELNQITSSMLFNWQVTPEVNCDPELARQGIEKLHDLGRYPAKNASIALENGSLVAVPSELGYEINIESTLDEIIANPTQILTSGYLKVQLRPVLPEISDATALISEADSMLGKGLKIIAYDPIRDESQELTISREEMASWFKVSLLGGKSQIDFDPVPIAAYLESQTVNLGNDRWIDGEKYADIIVKALIQKQVPIITISHKPTAYQIQKGETLLRISWKLGFPIYKILGANPGLDANKLYTGQTITVPSKDEMLPLPIVYHKRIVISISKQRLMVYQDGKQIHKYIISTGIDRSPTQPGVFQVLTHKPNAYASVWDLTMPNFLGIYEAWPGFMNGIHGLPVLSNGTRLWANILGKPASFGCIILDLPDSKELYQWAENGVVVEIQD